MKKIIILAISIKLMAGTYFTEYEIREFKLNVDTTCKNGHLTDIVYGLYKGKNIKVNQSHCVDYSEWNNRDCMHEPIKCIEDKK